MLENHINIDFKQHRFGEIKKLTLIFYFDTMIGKGRSNQQLLQQYINDTKK